MIPDVSMQRCEWVITSRVSIATQVMTPSPDFSNFFEPWWPPLVCAHHVAADVTKARNVITLKSMTSSDVAPEDATLLERWAAKDRAAGQLLFKRYYPLLDRFFANKAASESKELIQQTFLALLDGIDRLRDPRKFRAFVFSTARYIWYGHLRKSYQEKKGVPPADVATVSVADVLPGPGSLLMKKREKRLLLEALRSLPSHLQCVLEMRYWEDMSSTEIGEIVEKPAPTVRSQIAQAKKRLLAKIHELARSPEELKSTVSDLDQWASECRRIMDTWEGRDESDR